MVAVSVLAFGEDGAVIDDEVFVEVSFDLNWANPEEAPLPPASLEGVLVGAAYGELPVLTEEMVEPDARFLGWYTEAADGSVVTADTIVENGLNHTLYAQWEYAEDAAEDAAGDDAGEYAEDDAVLAAEDDVNALEGEVYVDVSFDLNWPAGVGTAPAPPADMLLLEVGLEYGPLPVLTFDMYAPNYRFLGWFAAASGGNEVTADDIVVNALDHTLFAQWEYARTLAVAVHSGEFSADNTSTGTSKLMTLLGTAHVEETNAHDARFPGTGEDASFQGGVAMTNHA
ncbi:MAG: InlB B-repeat-containing protein, partial [Clostridiales Family XIII bacterium]|nr:InlB B-repeat-containing protein [Clostridiales Family XIII bacterium]